MSTLRGTAIAYIDNSSVLGTITLPAGAAVGDFFVLFAEHGNPIHAAPWWEQLDNSTGSNANGAVYAGYLAAADIASNSLTVSFSAAYYGTLALAVFVGGTAFNYRTSVALRDSASGISATLTTDATPQAGEYALYFSGARFNGSISSSAGTSLRTSAGANASATLAGGALGSSGAVSDTFTFSATPLGDYEAIVVVYSAAKTPLQLRSPLFATEALNDGAKTATNVRAALLVTEALSDSNSPTRQLRCPFFCVESLHPVDPEGHVSTELFPGSLGSLTSLPGLTFSIHKRPTFSTAVHKGASGVSVRQANMQYPIWEFELSYEFLRDNVNSEFQTLCGFFLSRLGGFDTFLLKDKDDYNVVGGVLGTGDGVTTQFAFKRTLGGFAEKIGQVDNGATINIYKNGVLQTIGYTVVLPNLLVFTSAPTAGVVITADFQFFFNCRFQDDAADFDKFAEGFWELQKIVLETVPQ